MNRLFVYGTLCPNRENAHILAAIGGEWDKGSVHGTVHILAINHGIFIQHGKIRRKLANVR